MIEQLLRDRVCANLQLVMKGLQMYDYNMDGKVTRQDLRKVLENSCFKFTDQQFDKLWLTFNFQHNGLISYKDFLRQLGVNVSQSNSAQLRNASSEANKWPRVTGQNKVMAIQMKKSLRDDEKLLLSLSDEQIEAEFRSRMRSNYLKLKKAFMALDKHMDGSVSIEAFKSILCSFTLPMSDQTFLHLMGRCGVKASGRVAWEILLEKFQNTVAVGNGQTLPIRPNYRIYPSMETQTTADWSIIWKELYKRVNTHFNSLKEAFLQIDKNRDGLVTKKEFRELIERFIFRLDDGQFKELMLKIDPDKSNKIDYHTFLRLFEEKETKEGHKWLRSVHKYNSESKPTLLSWKTVEELLQEKIVYYWKNMSDWLKYYDCDGTGYLSKSTLKKVIDLQVMPVSDEHFKSLISRCTDFHHGKVNYMEFLGKLGVDVSPGDFKGLSSQIIDGSSHAEMKRQLDQVQRHDQITTNQCHRTSHMTAEEVIILFKDKVSQLTPELRKAFMKNDKQNKGTISQKQLRKILAELGIYMSDGQFSELISRLNLPSGSMQYMDFVNNFDSSLQDGATSIVNRLNNHRVNAIRGDEYGMTAVEAGEKLKQKLRENFSNLREAFYKFDDLHQGCLSKSGFRRMLNSFMIFMSDMEYDKFCEALEIMRDSRISYLEFLERFEPRDLLEGHKWLNSVHRFNKTHKPKLLTASEAHTLLAQKAHEQWNDLSKAFRSINCKGNGIITKPELQETLNKFVMPMEPAEFKKLWKRLDTDNKNYISHQDFLQTLGALEYAPGDNGPSGSILEGNYQFLKNHSRKQQEKHEDITWNQTNLAMNLSVEAVERLLRDKIRDSYSDFYTAFRKYDTNKLGFLSMADIQKILNEQHIFINDQQFFALMNRIGLPTYGSCINYAEFLNAFEDGRKSSYGHRRPRDVKIEKYESLSPEDAEAKLKMKLNVSINDVFKTLTAFDKDDSGKVQVADFRRVLDMFCFVLTDSQWKHIQTGLTINADQCVEYKNFLSQFARMEADNWEVYRQSPLIDSTSALPVIDEVMERMHQAVVSHYHNILRDFESLDPAKTGSVTVDELRDVVTRNIMAMNEQQFEKLNTVCPRTEDNNIDYKLFMKMFSEDMPLIMNPTPLPPTTDRVPSQMFLARPSTSRSQRSGSRLSSRSSSHQSRSSQRPNSRMSTPMINAESAETQVKDAVFRHWHEMQKRCRDMDVDGSGTIGVRQFQDLLHQYRVLLPLPDFNNLITKYDISENGRFCYRDFIRHFLMTVKPSEKIKLINREKMLNKKLYNSEATINEHEETEDSLRRIEDCVSQNWKEMRREFRSADPETQGKVSTDEFRRTLRKFNINISENEFHLLQDKYDKDFLDLISYNDFLKDNLQRISK